MKRVLIVEDNADLAFGLRNNLELEGYAVHVAEDGHAALEAFRDTRADLVILDLMIPEIDGFNVLKALRQADAQVPILILTARGEEVDKVTGLRLGADDYVTKPFGLLELLARVEALLRRTTPDARLSFGAIDVDLATRTVTRAGSGVDLSPREFDLLVALIRHGGAVVSRQKLLDEVWGYAADVLSRTVDTHVAELRRKLELDPSRPRHIVTVRKAGYRLVR
jgi:two-component system, OmpR family, alkaline phosphatase synthesis response regulator PhoP